MVPQREDPACSERNAGPAGSDPVSLESRVRGRMAYSKRPTLQKVIEEKSMPSFSFAGSLAPDATRML